MLICLCIFCGCVRTATAELDRREGSGLPVVFPSLVIWVLRNSASRRPRRGHGGGLSIAFDQIQVDSRKVPEEDFTLRSVRPEHGVQEGGSCFKAGRGLGRGSHPC